MNHAIKGCFIDKMKKKVIFPSKYLHISKFIRIFAKKSDVFIFMEGKYKINENIKTAIQKADKPTVFFISDFPEYGHEYVRKVLSALVEEGELIRLAKGVYMRPTMTRLGPLHPSTDAIALAIADRDSANILPTGAAAENLLGLSEQVPMNLLYLTDGSSRVLTLDKQTIRFKRVVPKTFAIKNKTLAILSLAMKSIGEDNLTDEHLGRILQILIREMGSESFTEDIRRMPIGNQRIINKLLKEYRHE